MNSKEDLAKQVMMAAQGQGISSVLLRNTMARKLGLNITESEALSFLAMKKTATPTEIARYTGLTSGSTTTMLDRLEKAGFIRRKPNPNDRRGVLVEAEEKWSHVAKPLVTDLVQAHAKLIDQYSPEQLQAIKDFLVRFTENVTNHTKNIDK